MTEKKQIEIYQSEDGQTQIQVRLEKDTIWLSQTQMAELFDKNSDTVKKLRENGCKVTVTVND